MNAGGALVFLADFLDEAASHEILKLFISTKSEHLLSTADRIANFEVFKNPLEKIIEPEYFLFRKYGHQFIGDMVGEAA